MVKESISLKIIVATVERLSTLPFFPSDDGARKAIMNEIKNMCWTNEWVTWLGSRMIHLYDRWPGMREMRAVLCARIAPADGIDAVTAVFTDGIPPESAPGPWERQQLTTGEMKQLGEAKGASETEARAIASANDRFIKDLAPHFDFPRAKR